MEKKSTNDPMMILDMNETIDHLENSKCVGCFEP